LQFVPDYAYPRWASVLSWDEGSPDVMALANEVVVGEIDSARNLVKARLVGERFEPLREIAIPGHRADHWASDEQRLAVFLDREFVASFSLGGEETFRRPAARFTNRIILAPGGRTIWSELRSHSDWTTVTHWIQAVDAKGDYVWSHNHELAKGPEVELALSPDGTVHVASAGKLLRLSNDGTERSLVRPGAIGAIGGLVVDREGVAYTATASELVAVAPDGAVIFRIEEALRPLAIDSFGRLVATHPRHGIAAIE
jgi:hypothetical protein